MVGHLQLVRCEFVLSVCPGLACDRSKRPATISSDNPGFTCGTRRRTRRLTSVFDCRRHRLGRRACNLRPGRVGVEGDCSVRVGSKQRVFFTSTHYYHAFQGVFSYHYAASAELVQFSDREFHVGLHARCRGGRIATPTMAAAVFAVGAAQLAKRLFSALNARPRPS